MIAAMGLGLRAARESIAAATERVTASAETITNGILAAIGIAVGAFLLACVALVIAVQGRRAAA